LNKVIIIGNLGSDPEMRYTPSGDAVTSFNVASNRKYTTGEGEIIEETEWFKVSAWGKRAENCNEYLSKGRQVYVEGRLSTDSYQGRDGAMRFSLNVNANDVVFLGGTPSDDEQDAPDPKRTVKQPSRAGTVRPASRR
jgi:single-strand DNA-binding protein